jgi:hypothetical protein
MAELVSEARLHVVGPEGRFPTVTLEAPSGSGFAVLALEMDRRSPLALGFWRESRAKREVLRRLKREAALLAEEGGVVDASLFKALLAPPGRGRFLKRRPEVPVARFDLVLLVETETPEHARRLLASSAWERVASVGHVARRALAFTATNVRRMGPVDHGRPGVFPFNWFYADDVDQNLAVWEHTAGWFETETDLHNSTLLLPDPAHQVPYTVVNHCRWDRLADVLSALILERGFRGFVLASFEANNTAAMPILYRLA